MPEPRRLGLDAIGWFVANSHGLLGHDKTAALIGQPAGDKARCVLCRYEAAPTAEARLAVIEALGVPSGSHAPTCRTPS